MYTEGSTTRASENSSGAHRHLEKIMILVLRAREKSLRSSACYCSLSYFLWLGHRQVPKRQRRRKRAKLLTNPTGKLVVSINAANGITNWDRVSSGANLDWRVQEVVLRDFGPTMRDSSFTAALDESYLLMQRALEDLQPDVWLASSKGVGVIAYLASKNLWAGPIVLLSPIPNPKLMD